MGFSGSYSSRFPRYGKNPGYLDEALSESGFSSFYRLIFKGLMDFCWSSEKVDRCFLDDDSLSQYLGIDNSVLSSFSDFLFDKSEDTDIFSVEVDLESESGGFILVVHYLTDEFKACSYESGAGRSSGKKTKFGKPQKNNSKPEQVTDIDSFRFDLKANELGEASIRRRTSLGDSDEPSQDPSIVYVKSPNTKWANDGMVLPAKRYDLTGEAFRVNSILEGKLRELYPDSNPGVMIPQIKKWLLDNPSNRPSIAGMNRFIVNWFDKGVFLAEAKSKNSSDISKIFDEVTGSFSNKVKAELGNFDSSQKNSGFFFLSNEKVIDQVIDNLGSNQYV